jgi:ParB family chromosome partitioning protein
MQSRKPETTRSSAQTDATLMGQERGRREVVELLLREVMPNRQQPRATFDEESLRELAASIELHGVLEPIIVREIPLTSYEGYGRHYELIAGERRWRAGTLAGITTIPALVLPEGTTDQAALELAITENLQREDLHPIDEAIAFGRMQRDLGYSFAQIAERLGKSKGYVQNRMRLLQLDVDLQQLVKERPDTLSHVYELAKVVEPEQRRALIDAVSREGLSLTETKARVQEILSPPVGEDESYLHKYDREHNHPSEETRQGSSGSARSIRSGQAAGMALTPRERAALVATAVKVERFLDNPDLLSEEDWAVLSPLARRLADLMREVGQARDGERAAGHN